jgi:hypothetical protein
MTHQVGSPEDLPETDMAILLGLSLLLVQYVVNELPLILDIVPRDFSVKASKERLALLVKVPSGAIPRRFYRRLSC